MNRYAPPASDVGDPAPSLQLGKAGWLAASATLVQLTILVVGYPHIPELFLAHPVAVFFVHIAAATSLFLVLGTLLLLRRFPSSMLLFIAALATALLDFRNAALVLPVAGLAASMSCLAISARVFFKSGRRQPVEVRPKP